MRSSRPKSVSPHARDIPIESHKPLPPPLGALSLGEMLAVLADKTKIHLSEEMSVSVSSVRTDSIDATQLNLEHLTAIIGVGGSAGLLVAFSFSAGLTESLYERIAAILDIPPGSEDLYRQATLGEIANIAVGAWMGDLAPATEAVSITPPIILEGGRRICPVANAAVSSVTIETKRGMLRIHLIGPQFLFGEFLRDLQARVPV